MGPPAKINFDPGAPPEGHLEVRLGPEQIAAYQENGFTSIDRITTDEEVAWLRQIYDHLFNAGRGAFDGGYFDLARPYESDGDDLVPQVLTPELQFPQLRVTTFAHNALAVAAQLLNAPPDELIAWGHMILKPPRVGSELPWHQDEAYWDERWRYRAVGCWLPLDEATLESGCMQFIPGSHRDDVRPHRHIGDNPEIHGLVTDGVADGSAVAVPLAAGGASFHGCRTLHRSMPNTSEGPRRAYIIECQVKPKRLPADEVPSRPWGEEFREAWKARDLSN